MFGRRPKATPLTSGALFILFNFRFYDIGKKGREKRTSREQSRVRVLLRREMARGERNAESGRESSSRCSVDIRDIRGDIEEGSKRNKGTARWRGEGRIEPEANRIQGEYEKHRLGEGAA